MLASHGKDGKGAYGKSGTLIAACGAVGKDIENCNGDDIFMDSRFNMGDIAANSMTTLSPGRRRRMWNLSKPPSYFPLSLRASSPCAASATVWSGAGGEIGRQSGRRPHHGASYPLSRVGDRTGQPGDKRWRRRFRGLYLEPVPRLVLGRERLRGSARLEEAAMATPWIRHVHAPFRFPGWRSVAGHAGETVSCALKSDGTLWS